MEAILIGLVVVNVLALVGSKVLKKKTAVTTEGISVDSVQAAFNRSRNERFTLIARFLKGRKEASVIERNLTTANIMLKPTEFVALNLVVLIVSTIVALVMLSTVIPNEYTFISLLKRVGFLFVMVFFVGWKGPQMVLQFLANQRRTKLEYQLADALTIISSSLKGGYSFVQGLAMAGEQMEEPIKGEVQRVIRLIQLGLDTTKALQQMSDRVNSYDYDMTISATNIQLAVGGNLSLLLEGIAATIRDRIRLRRDVAALTAQGRISGAILFVLPIAIGLFLCGLNWEYMSNLFTPTGYLFLYVAMAMQAAGFFWIKKLLDFDN